MKILSEGQQPESDQPDPYTDIVRQLASGDRPDFGQVCFALAAAGKSATELVADVAKFKERAEQ